MILLGGWSRKKRKRKCPWLYVGHQWVYPNLEGEHLVWVPWSHMSSPVNSPPRLSQTPERMNSFMPFISFWNLIFAYMQNSDWFISFFCVCGMWPRKFVFSQKATLSFDVLMWVCGNELLYLLFFPCHAVVFSKSVLSCLYRSQLSAEWNECCEILR